MLQSLFLQIPISIHAPAKGATTPGIILHGKYMISIHAPAKGATSTTLIADLLKLQFQSTLPRRERPKWGFPERILLGFQSTLPRRERLAYSTAATGTTNFNPRSREGSDVLDGIYILSLRIFQSTLPRRERQRDAGSVRQRSNISIHAPAKGATRMHSIPVILFRHFNPRSREGSDNCFTDSLNSFFNFNPRSREGSDLHNLPLPCLSLISIHAPAKGATEIATATPVFTIISIHAPAKGAT